MANLLTIRKDNKIDNNGWAAKSQHPYEENLLEDIEEVIPSDVSKILTSIPSPFAQIHLFETAFSYVKQKGKNHLDGNTLYHKLISHVFDILELLFNFNFMQEAHQLKIYEWGLKKIFEDNENQKDGYKLFFQSLRNHIKDVYDNIEINDNDVIYIIMSKNNVIAGSSPKTLFFTAANIPDDLDIPRPDKSGKRFFKDIVPLNERSQKFIKYLYYFVRNNELIQKNAINFYQYLDDYKGFNKKIQELISNEDDSIAKYKPITTVENRELKIFGTSFTTGGEPDLNDILTIKTKDVYLKKYKGRIPIVYPSGRNLNDQEFTYKLKQENLRSNINERILPDISINYPCLFLDDFLGNTIIRVPFKIDSKYFYGYSYTIKDEEAYLLPLKPLFFEFFDIEQIDELFKINKINNDTIEVILRIPTQTRYVEYKKNYFEGVDSNDNIGRIEDYKLNLAVAPFHYYQAIKEVNNCYQVMLVDYERRDLYRNTVADIKFFKKIENSQDTQKIYSQLTDKSTELAYVEKIERDKKEKDKINQPAVNYYVIKTDNGEGKDAKFDFMQIEIGDYNKVTNIIVPKFSIVEDSFKPIKFAIDFGTSNTYVAYSIDGGEPKDFEITNDNLQVITLSKFNVDTNEAIFRKYFDSLPIKPIGIDIQIKNKFRPIILEREDKPSAIFKNPFRTALVEKKDTPVNKIALYGSDVIAFGYQNIVIPGDDFDIVTDLKWNEKKIDRKRYREIFIEELLYIIKDFMISNKCDFKRAQIILFYPLSLGDALRNELTNIWKHKIKDVFAGIDITVNHYSESFAPYYFMRAANKLLSTQLCANIDIGGGSCDFVLYQDRKPICATSTYYGANILWDTTTGEIDNKIHPIFEEFLKYKENWAINNNEYLNLIANYYVANKHNVPAKELMQIFLANDKYFKVTEFLRQQEEYKIIYLLYFGSLIYYLAQIIEKYNYDIPSYITLSGNGALTVNFIELKQGDKLYKLNSFTNYIFEKVLSKKKDKDITVKVLDEPKKLTCKGALMIKENDELEADKLILYGDIDLKLEARNSSDNKIIVQKKKEKELFTKENKNIFVNNVKNYLKIIKEFARNYNLKEDLGIEFNYQIYDDLLNSLDYIYENILNHLGQTDDDVNTPVFFTIMQEVIKEYIFIIYNNITKSE